MANKENSVQYKRTVARTGKWRGQSIDSTYHRYKSTTTAHRCDHLIVDQLGVCENCRESVGRGLNSYKKQTITNYQTKL